MLREFGLPDEPMYDGDEYSDFRITELMTVLGRGKEHAVSRKTLAKELDMQDRAMRELIEKARREGCLISNDQDGAGYYIPITIAEVKSFYKQNYARAMSLLVGVKKARKVLKEAGELDT